MWGQLERNGIWYDAVTNITFFLVQQYIIRTSENIIDLRDNFNKSLQVNTTHLIPKEANSKETFAFKPETVSGEDATYIFIAIESVDKSNWRSGLSNIAQVALFTPQADPIPEESPQSGVSITTIVLSVVGAIVLVCIIVSTTVCILKRKRSSSGPATTF